MDTKELQQQQNVCLGFIEAKTAAMNEKMWVKVNQNGKLKHCRVNFSKKRQTLWRLVPTLKYKLQITGATASTANWTRRMRSDHHRGQRADLCRAHVIPDSTSWYCFNTSLWDKSSQMLNVCLKKVWNCKKWGFKPKQDDGTSEKLSELKNRLTQ